MANYSDKRVLVVDDQKSMRGMARYCLTEVGVGAVDSVESAEKAIERMKTVKYDLIISDWNMDGMSGLDFLKAVRASQAYKDLPFIMATSERSKELIVAAKQAGVSHYIVKPFAIDDVRKRLDAVLGKKAAAA